MLIGPDLASCRRVGWFADLPRLHPAEVTLAGGVTVRVPRSVAGTDGSTSRGSIPSASANSELSYYEMGAVAKGNVLVVLEWISMGDPGDDASDAWVWTAGRSQTAITDVTS